MSHQRAILIVDDDPAILSTVAEILEFEGYPVETATNGLEALTLLDTLSPSLILLDMRMPLMDGWQFSRLMRERGLRHPILVMTAAQDAQRWAQEIEADGVLPKPFDLADLLEAVEQHRGPTPLS